MVVVARSKGSPKDSRSTVPDNAWPQSRESSESQFSLVPRHRYPDGLYRNMEAEKGSWWTTNAGVGRCRNNCMPTLKRLPQLVCKLRWPVRNGLCALVATHQGRMELPIQINHDNILALLKIELGELEASLIEAHDDNVIYKYVVLNSVQLLFSGLCHRFQQLLQRFLEFVYTSLDECCQWRKQLLRIFGPVLIRINWLINWLMKTAPRGFRNAVFFLQRKPRNLKTWH